MSTTWTFTCVNHPQLRWTKNKCGPGFIGRGVLAFEGDLETGKRAPDCFVQSENSLAAQDAEYQQHYREKYAVECDCPMSDLRVHAEEYVPFSEMLAEQARV